MVDYSATLIAAQLIKAFERMATRHQLLSKANSCRSRAAAIFSAEIIRQDAAWRRLRSDRFMLSADEHAAHAACVTYAVCAAQVLLPV